MYRGVVVGIPLLLLLASVVAEADQSSLSQPAVSQQSSPAENRQSGTQAESAYRQGVALLASHRYQEAEQVLSRSLIVDHNFAAAYVSRAYARFALSNLEGAGADLSTALTINPRNTQAYNLRGLLHEKRAEYQAAIDDYAAALAIEPDLQSARINLAAVRIQQGGSEQALQTFKDLVQNPGGLKAAEERITLALMQRDFKKAIQGFDLLVAVYPRNIAYLNDRGSAKKHSGDHDGARADFHAALAINPAADVVRKNLAQLPPVQQPTAAEPQATVPTAPGVHQQPVVAEQADVTSIPPAAADPPVPFVLPEPLAVVPLTQAQYQGGISAALETMRLIMGPLSADDEKRFSAAWAAHFEFPTEESRAYFDKLNPLLAEFVALKSAIASAAVEFDSAWDEAVTAAGYASENGTREALSIAATQNRQMRTLQQRLEQVVAAVQALGNPPDPHQAKQKAAAAHEAALAVVKKVIKPAATGVPKKDERTTSQPLPVPTSGVAIRAVPDRALAGTTIELEVVPSKKIAESAVKYKWRATSLGTADLLVAAGEKVRIPVRLVAPKGEEKEEISVTALDAKGFGPIGGSAKLTLPLVPLAIRYHDATAVSPPRDIQDAITFGRLPPGMTGDSKATDAQFEQKITTWDLVNTPKGQVKHTFEAKQYSFGTVRLGTGVSFHRDPKEEFDDTSVLPMTSGARLTTVRLKKTTKMSLGEFTGDLYEYEGTYHTGDGWERLFRIGRGILKKAPGTSAGHTQLPVWYEVGSYNEGCGKPDDACRQTFEALHAQSVKRLDTILSTLRMEHREAPARETIPPKDVERIRDSIAFHQANIRIIEKSLARDEADLAKEKDPLRRAALEFRILAARSDILAEKDLIASRETGTLVHTRSPFDDYAQAQFIVNIKENQRRMEEFQRTTAALNRLAGMLPGDEAEQARAFVKRQLPLSSMASLDTHKARAVAAALGEKVQGYYLSAAAQEEEKAAWAGFGMEAAQNIKAAADAGLMATSMFGGRGVMVAYQGVTGYVAGGPVEAVSRAAFMYSTPAAVMADALKGYQEEGWGGAAKNAAQTYIGRKAYEYGAQKLLGNNQLTQFKQARQEGEALAKSFARAQGELDRLGKTGAAAVDIIRQQQVVRELVATVNASPHAKNFLKYKGDYHSQKAYTSHLKATHAEVEARFHNEMQRLKWNRQELQEFRNTASAGSVGMDYDIGLKEQPLWRTGADGKLVRNHWLLKDGKPVTVDQWQADAQKAWEKSYQEVTGRSASQAWEKVTTRMDPESYRDLNLLGADKSRVQAIWAQQSADVTRYKMHHMLNDPTLNKMEALQEVSRGTAKDMATKLLPLMEQTKVTDAAAQQALAGSKRHWQKITSVLEAFGKNDIDPITAQRRIRELTGKGIPEVVDDAATVLESMIKAQN